MTGPDTAFVYNSEQKCAMRIDPDTPVFRRIAHPHRACSSRPKPPGVGEVKPRQR